MNKITRTEEGVMFMKDGLAWGVVYKDGQVTEMGWVDPANATKSKVYISKFLAGPSSITAAFSHDPNLEELEKGSMVRVKRTTVVEILKGDDNDAR